MYRDIVGLPDPALPKELQCHQLANRAFIYLAKQISAEHLDHAQQLIVWQGLVHAVQAMRPDWVCEGPYEVVGGAQAFKGTAGYIIVFRPNGEVLLGKSDKIRPDVEWMPPYRTMMTLEFFLTKITRK